MISNFFPNLRELESKLGSKGFGLYARGFNTLHQNPLNWKKSKIGIYRNSIERTLSQIDFNEGHRALVTIHPHLHSYTALELQFPDHFLYSFPPMTLLEQLPSNKLEEIYERLKIDKFEGLNLLLKEGEFPLLLLGNDVWSEYLKVNTDLDKIPQFFERNNFCNWLNLALWKHLIESESLDKLYEVNVLNPDYNTELFMYVHRKFSENKYDNPKSYKPGLISLKDKYRKLTNPEIIIAKLLFDKASNHFNKNQFWEASILLRLANQLDPLHEDIKQDLKIVMNSLPSQMKIKHQHYRIGGEAEKLQSGLDKLWDYKGNIADLNLELRNYLLNPDKIAPGKKEAKKTQSELPIDEAEFYFRKASKIFNSNQNLAKDYLIKTLKLNPNHSNALRDLKILEKSSTITADSPSQFNISAENEAEKLFKESSIMLTKNKVRALILLRKVLKLNPNHKEAIRDLEILKSELGITQKNKQ